MPAFLGGDYSKLPEGIREAFPYVAGAVCDLRQTWLVYHRLFMESHELTEILSERLGGLLGLIQMSMEDSLLISIARLTDKHNRSQRNLSIWVLQEGADFCADPAFSTKVKDSAEAVYDTAENIRKHRHKRLAHHDLEVSLKASQLPQVTFPEIKALLEMIEAHLNLFFWEYAETTMRFDLLHTNDLTACAEATALKARAYDRLETEGLIQHHEWWKDRPA